MKWIYKLLFLTLILTLNNTLVFANKNCKDITPAGNRTTHLSSSEVTWDISGSITDRTQDATLNSITVSGFANTFTDILFPNSTTYQLPSASAACLAAERESRIFENTIITADITQGAAIFNNALINANTSRNIRNYLSLDCEIATTDYINFHYDEPFTSAENRYIMISERHGNNLMRINALDSSGNIIGTGADYIPNTSTIDTGFETDYGQHVFFTIYPLTALLPVGQNIHGIRLTQTGANAAFSSPGDGGDGKVFIMFDPFTRICIEALDDDFTATPIAGGDTTGSVFANNGSGTDKANNENATDSNIHDNISLLGDGGLTGVTINTNGTLNIPNTATTGTYDIPYQICLSTDSTHCATAIAKVRVLSNPSINLVKSVTAPNGIATTIGDIVTYSFLITNTGDVPLTNVNIDDARIGVQDLVVPNLAVGASETVTADYTITASDMIDQVVNNTAIAAGTSPNNINVTDTDSATLNLQEHPSINLVKSVTAPNGIATTIGDIVTYSFLITNTGDVPLTNVNIDDARIGVQDLVVPNLAVDMNYTVYADYTITAQDLLEGKVENTALATGTSPTDTAVFDTSDDDNPTEDDPTVTILNKLGIWTGRVLQDTNFDDIGDKPLADVMIMLYSLDSDSNILRVTSTNSNGEYIFSNLYAGRYRAIETQPNILLNVSENEGGDDDDVGNDNIINSITGIVSSGENDSGNDFVDVLPFPKPIKECTEGFEYLEFNPEIYTIGRSSDPDLVQDIEGLRLNPESVIEFTQVLTYDYGTTDQSHEQYRIQIYNDNSSSIDITPYTTDIDNKTSVDIYSNLGTLTNTSKNVANFRVKHWAADNNSNQPNSVSLKSLCYKITPTPSYFETPPDNPTNIRLISKTSRSIILGWDDNSANENGFTIYENGIPVKSVNQNITSLIIEGLIPERDYTYSVKAFNHYGQSEKISITFKLSDDFGWLPAILHNILN